MNWKYDISVITPTYNRGIFLAILYDSLIKQRLKNFEWVVVDDGSSDDTKKNNGRIYSRWINRY